MNRVLVLSEVQVGMVLGADASVQGQVLLSAGTTVTAAHLTLLAARGVRSLAIAVPAAGRMAIDPKLVLACDRHLRPRFVRCDLQHPALKEIYRLALLRRLHQASLAPTGGTHAG
jgi:hypothetical protein